MHKALKSIIVLLLFGAFVRILVFATSGSEESDHIFQQKFNEKYGVYALTLPEDLTFAGEEVPFDDPEIYERFDRELLSNTYFQSQGILYFKRAARYFPVIEKILKEEGIPDDFKYLALIESGLSNVVSPAGASGFWQFMPDAAKQYGLEINTYVDERYHFEKSTYAACRYLKEAYRLFGSWTLAAAAYNAGKTGVKKKMDEQKVSNYYDLYLNQETARYIFRILAVKEILNNPLKYGFHLRETDLYDPYQTRTVRIDTNVMDLVQLGEQFGLTYKLIKYYNPWLRSDKLMVYGNTYELQLPKKGKYRVMTERKEMYPELESEIDSVVSDKVIEKIEEAKEKSE